LLSETAHKADLFRHHSGGSTGRPVSFYRDRQDADLSEAGSYRTLEQCGWKPGEMVAFIWGSNEKVEKMSRLEFEARQILRRSYLFDPFASSAEDMDRWIKRWRRLRPSVAFGYASTLARFAAHVERCGAKLPPLKGAFTTAEKLYKPQRETIERALHCKAFDCYGSSEVRNIAAECPNGSMHLHSDFVVAETEPGGPGARPFLFTALNNYAMPFIRYRNEDCGQLLSETRACGCGSNFPVMKLDVARVSDSFTFPGGRVVHGEYFTHLMYGSDGIESFQFHQIAREKMVLWVVPGPGDADRRAETVRKAVEEVKRLAPCRIEVEVRETDSIELSAQGKHRFTRSDVPVSETAETPIPAGE
jgi:phenylacetate-CoA ligase